MDRSVFFAFVAFFAHWSSRRGFVDSLVLLVKMKISQQPASIIAQSINPAKTILMKNPSKYKRFQFFLWNTMAQVEQKN